MYDLRFDDRGPAGYGPAEPTTNTTMHTPAPWIADGRLIYALTLSKHYHSPVNRFMATMSHCNDEDGAPKVELEANAARAVACVNACEGIEGPAQALELARHAIRRLMAAHAALTPGLRGMAVDDYALQNEAPIEGAKALRALGG